METTTSGIESQLSFVDGVSRQPRMFLRSSLGVLRHLTDMSRITTDIFRYLFFDSDENARRSAIDSAKDQENDPQMEEIGASESRYRKNEYDTSSMTRKLQRKINLSLKHSFEFIEVKAQQNITMNL
jgi:hypothetical protein